MKIFHTVLLAAVLAVSAAAADAKLELFPLFESCSVYFRTEVPKAARSPTVKKAPPNGCLPLNLFTTEATAAFSAQASSI